jgi:biopolymer transport protein TolQ
VNNVLIRSYLESDWFGKAILIGLFCMSIYAWAIMALKWRMIKEITAKKNELFKMLNRTQGSVLTLYQPGNPLPESPFQAIYETLCAELNVMLDLNVRHNKPKRLTNIQMNNLTELSDCTISNQIIGLEGYLLVLATTSSISPLLGLLGTVWGILISFQGVANVGSMSLAVIAPGMAEALVTTVGGLLVAMPALIGYNWITNRIGTITTEMENFSSRILAHIQSIYCTSSSYEKEPEFSANA